MSTIQSDHIKVDSFDIGGVTHRIAFLKEGGHPLLMGPRLPYVWVWGHGMEIPSQPRLRMSIDEIRHEVTQRGVEICGMHYLHYSTQDRGFYLSRSEHVDGQPFSGIAFYVASDLKKSGVAFGPKTAGALEDLLRRKVSLINTSINGGFYAYQIRRIRPDGGETLVASRGGFRSLAAAEASSDLMLDVVREGVPAR